MPFGRDTRVAPSNVLDRAPVLSGERRDLSVGTPSRRDQSLSAEANSKHFAIVFAIDVSICVAVIPSIAKLLLCLLSALTS